VVQPCFGKSLGRGVKKGGEGFEQQVVHGRAGAVGVVQKKGVFSGFARSLCRDVVHLIRRSNLQDVCFINTRFTRLGWHGRYVPFGFGLGGKLPKSKV
jgi:hypothetical protein